MRSTPVQVSATSPAHLASLLDNINPETHGDPRYRKESREFWILAQAISKAYHLLPDGRLTLRHCDRPDFWLEMQDGMIAIEVTNVIPEMYAEALEVLEDTEQVYSVNGLFMAGDHLGRSTGRSKREKRLELRALIDQALSFSDHRSYGDDWESRITTMIEARFSDKKTKVRSYPFAMDAAARWLILYDRASPAGTDLARAVADYRSGNADCAPFDVVLLLTDSRLFELH